MDCGIFINSGRSILTTQDENFDRIYIAAETGIRYLSWLIPIGIWPIASEAFGLAKPWTTRAIFALTVAASVAFWIATYSDVVGLGGEYGNLMLWAGQMPEAAEVDATLQSLDPELAVDDDARAMLLEYIAAVAPYEYRWYQLLTHGLLHGDLLHLASNMIFLMVLGSRVNALLGNGFTLAAYPILMVAAAWAQMHSQRDELFGPMLGASGAVMGLAGMYIVFFPAHKVHVAAWWRRFFWLSSGVFQVRGFWVVLFYISFDVLFTLLRAEDGVAHWAHLGGFAAGFVLALVLLLCRVVDGRGGDLLSVLLGRHAWALLGRPRRAATQEL